MSQQQIPATAVVPVTSAWTGKVNWTQAVAIVSSILTLVFGPQAGLSPEQQAAIVTTITIIQGLVTWILKTWFTPTVHAASLPSTTK